MNYRIAFSALILMGFMLNLAHLTASNEGDSEEEMKLRSPFKHDDEDDDEVHDVDDPGAARKKKIFTYFSLVRFANTVCRGSNNRNGTCYTQQECSAKGGTDAGSCAMGYGICCIISLGCGGRSSENCTYFEAAAANSGSCKATICPCGSNICQLRLDFTNFVITGPSTATTSTVKLLNGGVTPAGTLSANMATQCLTDRFTVTSGGITPPTICGTNSGEHMYVDADQACNMLQFTLGTNGLGATVGTRSWNIKITQYSCDHPNLAPSGCTQYYYGSSSQTVKSYNYDGGSHLANQCQNICVRRERNNCRICWTATTNIDFQVSGMTTKTTGHTKGSVCCGYVDASGFDCIQLPGVVQNTASASLKGNEFCGRALATAEGGAAATVCSRSNSFSLKFKTDNYEYAGAAPMEATTPDRGFQLTFIQTSC